jgi:GxxExxY protein
VDQEIKQHCRKNVQKAQNMKTQKEIFQLCDQIRETAFALHRYLRHGYLEKVHENRLANRLRKAGIQVEQQFALHVLDEDGTVLGDYFADLFVAGEFIVELKACKALADEHGLLINFGSSKLEVRKFVLSDAV